MSKKNTIKDSAEFCLLCGKRFANNKEKHINKIRRNKRHSKHNSVVLCSECKLYLDKSKIEIFECHIPEYIVDKYFKNFDRNTKYFILQKMSVLKCFKLRELKDKDL